MKLSIIIPVYNERNNLLKILKRVRESNIGNLKKEIIIVDDFSNDGTRDILNKIKFSNVKVILNKQNKGKGFAIKTALKYITGDVIIIQDADLEYDPNDYFKLLKPILNKEFKVVYGSRFLRKNKTKKNMFYFGNKLLSGFTSLLYLRKITDMETCYKVFTKDVIKDMKINSNRFDFEPEFTSKVLNQGYKIKEIPINYHPRTKNQGKKIKFFDGFIALWTLFRYRFSK